MRPLDSSLGGEHGVDLLEYSRLVRTWARKNLHERLRLVQQLPLEAHHIALGLQGVCRQQPQFWPRDDRQTLN